SAHGLGERTRRVAGPRRRSALDEAAAEHASLARRRVVEHAGLSGRDALLARDQFDFVAAVAAAQPRRLRRARRAHPHENLETVADGVVEHTVADPVDVAKPDAIHPQRLARTDDDAVRRRVEPQHVKRLVGRNAQSLALADGEVRDALMGAEHAAIEVDDVARLHRIRLQPADDVGVAPGRYEANVLAVMLVGNGEAKAPRVLA